MCETPCKDGKRGKCRENCAIRAVSLLQEQRRIGGIRADQEKKLEALEEKLIDVLLKEADPDRWPTEEMIIQRLDEALAAGQIDEKEYKALYKKASEKARYVILMEKKNANQTMALVTRMLAYRLKLEEARSQGSQPPARETEEMHKEMAEAEKRVKHRLKLVKGQRKAA